MNYLSLFTGVGGGDLAFQHLLEGFRCVGYVEIEEYCQKVIKQRIKDGLLDEAPIFGDIKTFISEGYAESYKGLVDLITGGFPCQPFSVAGKRKGEQDERNMWPQTIATIRLVRPKYCFFENVPGLLASGYMPQIFADLAQAGYNARWTVLGANDVGANHRRKRLWILAKSEFKQRWKNTKIRLDMEQNTLDKRQGQKDSDTPKTFCDDVSNSEKSNDRQGSSESINRQIQQFRKCDFAGNVAHAGKQGLSKPILKKFGGIQQKERTSKRCKSGRRMPTQGGNWTTEPRLGRVAHGVAHRVDRLKAIGNGQVPQVAATAWEILS